jgi:D-hexose-6-phosphate mutarotase
MTHLYKTQNVHSQNGNITVTLTFNFIEKLRKQLCLEQDEQITNEHLQKYFEIET